jgi:hypothetical protein
VINPELLKRKEQKTEQVKEEKRKKRKSPPKNITVRPYKGRYSIQANILASCSVVYSPVA